MKCKWGGARHEHTATLNRAILKNHYEWCKQNGYDTKWYNQKKGQHIAGPRTNDRKGKERNEVERHP